MLTMSDTSRSSTNVAMERSSRAKCLAAVVLIAMLALAALAVAAFLVRTA